MIEWGEVAWGILISAFWFVLGYRIGRERA